MDIQSFLFGMSVVLLIALAIGGVVALVKVGKLKKLVDLTENNRRMEMQGVYRETEDIRKSIDSRIDKTENKFSMEIENIKNSIK